MSINFQVSFLKNAPESFLKEITLITQKVVLVPDQVILHKGQEQNSMCFISHGELEVCMYVYALIYYSRYQLQCISTHKLHMIILCVRLNDIAIRYSVTE